MPYFGFYSLQQRRQGNYSLWTDIYGNTIMVTQVIPADTVEEASTQLIAPDAIFQGVVTYPVRLGTTYNKSILGKRIGKR